MLDHLISYLQSINSKTTDNSLSKESNYIFLAYSRQDNKAAEKLYKILVKNGIQVWYGEKIHSHSVILKIN